MLNLHRLLFKDADPVSFHEALLPLEAHKKTLTEAKNKIRDHLRSTISAASISILKLPREDRTTVPYTGIMVLSHMHPTSPPASSGSRLGFWGLPAGDNLGWHIPGLRC